MSNRGADEERDALRHTLETRFRTTETSFDIGGHALVLMHPLNAEDLIDEVEFERDERLPYWADVWPASRVLAQHLIGLRGRGRSLLELGCGAGLVATAAAIAGFRVCATDYYEEALLFTELNVWRNSGEVPRTRLVDWRRVPTNLGRFDVVVGSDVLYERDYGSLVARAIDMTLAAHGEAIIADPGRIAASDFIAASTARGVHVVSQERVTFVEGKIRQTIDLYELRR